MHKRFSKSISIITTIFMLLTIFVFPVSNVHAEKDENDIAWTEGVTGGAIYFDEATGTITGCDKSVTEVAIPKEINGIPVLKLGNWSFDYCDSLRSITIPDSITSIGYRAFASCSSLTNINIPESVTSIEDETFFACSSLININIPDGVTIIGNGSFHGCSSLSKVNIPKSVMSIGNNAFEGCYPLKNVNLPDGVKNIGDRAFRCCSSLDNINLPDSVTKIGDSAFAECYSLTSIDIPDGVTSIGNETFYNCFNLRIINIPNSVTKIGDSAFWSCEITAINIPNSVTSIGEDAFKYCDLLKKIIIPASVTNIGPNAFYECKALTIIGYSGSYAETYANKYNILFSALDEGKTEFEIGKDSNSFTHNNGIGDGFEGIYNTKLSTSFYNKLVANASKAEKDEILKVRDEKWGGSCHGISYTMALNYTGDLDLSKVKENTNYYDLPRPCENAYFLDTINYYQLMQYLKSYDTCTVSTCYGDVFSGLINLLYGGDDLETFLKKFVSQVESDEVVPFSFGVGLSGHTILALDCEKCEDGSYKIKLYNMNNNSSFMEMIIEADYSDFYYKDNVLGVVKKSTFKYIAFDDIDLLSEVGIASPLEVNSLSTYGLRNNNLASIIFDADESFTITVDGEDEILFDPEGYESDVSISNVSPIVTGNQLKYRMDFSTEESIKIENIDEDFKIDFLTEEEFYSAEVNNADEITINKNEGIVLDGEEYAFKTYSSAKAEDSELIKLTAETSGKTAITSEENKVKVVSENPLKNTGGSRLSDNDTAELEVVDGQTSLNFPAICQEKGWKEINDKWFYFNDYKATTGWAKINKKWYYFNDKGIMQTGLKDIDGEKYFLSDSGAMATGWKEIDGVWYYFQSSGAATEGWAKINKKWYYFSNNGIMRTGLKMIDGQKYYLSDSGAMLTGWQQVKGIWYYFNSSGAAVEGWKKISKKWYYFNKDNEMLTGLQTIGGEKYYFSSNDSMATGWLKLDEGWYYFASSGAVKTDWFKVGKTWYYGDPETGILYEGKWLEDTYYFKTGGAMATGWLEIEEDWYYFKSSGAAVEGWLQTVGQKTKTTKDDKWYYFDGDKQMVTGEYVIGGKTNLFNASGLWLGVKAN